MEFTQEIEINLPRADVVRLFDDPDNLPKWQRGLQSFDALAGDPGQPGSTSRLVFVNGRRRIEMIETITLRDLPDAFHGTYDAKGVHNVVENYFTEVTPGRTRWVAHNVFELRGLMRVVGLLFGRSFARQSRTFMEDFKAFAETGSDVRA
jgi:hypothetical protein